MNIFVSCVQTSGCYLGSQLTNTTIGVLRLCVKAIKCGYLCGLVVGICFDELLSRAAIGGVKGLSVGQRGGGGGGEGAGGGRRGRGGLGLQATEGVAPRGQQNSNPGPEPAPELILVK